MLTADGLDAERREALGQVRVGEPAGLASRRERVVPHVDPRRVEVGRVQPRAAGACGDREALVDRAAWRSRRRCAAVPNAGFQPLITPASEENRNGAALPSILKPPPPLNTVPVGAPCGIVTTSGSVVAPVRSGRARVQRREARAVVGDPRRRLGPNDSPQH